jgi:hypothetical protein
LDTADDLIRGLGLRGNPYQARKYFVLSLHRAGTRSTSELLEGLGLHDAAWCWDIASVEPLTSHPRDKRINKNLVKYYFTYSAGSIAAFISYRLSLRFV